MRIHPRDWTRQRATTQALAALVAVILARGCTTFPVIATSPGGDNQTSVKTDADYRRLENEIFTELNAARTNPDGYATIVAQLLSRFNGNLVQRPGWPAPVQTQEGVAAVREAVSALQAQAAVPAVALSSTLSLASRELAIDQARTGTVGHTGSDGSAPTTRIARYGTWGVSYAESVDYGGFVSGRDIVTDFIIDDGVPSRGHRRNVFDPTARIVGIACGPHPVYGSVCVIDQAGAFTPK
jgi:uncharacterized protein YkwD